MFEVAIKHFYIRHFGSKVVEGPGVLHDVHYFFASFFSASIEAKVVSECTSLDVLLQGRDNTRIATSALLVFYFCPVQLFPEKVENWDQNTPR